MAKAEGRNQNLHVKEDPNAEQCGQDVGVKNVAEKVAIVLLFNTSANQSAVVIPSNHLVLACFTVR